MSHIQDQVNSQFIKSSVHMIRRSLFTRFFSLGTHDFPPSLDRFFFQNQVHTTFKIMCVKSSDNELLNQVYNIYYTFTVINLLSLL